MMLFFIAFGVLATCLYVFVASILRAAGSPLVECVFWLPLLAFMVFSEHDDREGFL